MEYMITYYLLHGRLFPMSVFFSYHLFCLFICLVFETESHVAPGWPQTGDSPASAS
jgi:hypothetical protein